jgi:hypothetical protein
MNQRNDKEGLDYTKGDGFTTGYAPLVHGPESVECEEYRPTRHELAVLARYWLDEYYDIDLFHWESMCVGTASLKTMTYASRRLERIAMVLGDGAFKKLVEEVQQEFREEVGHQRFDEYVRQDTGARDRRLAADNLLPSSDHAPLGASPP